MNLTSVSPTSHFEVAAASGSVSVVGITPAGGVPLLTGGGTIRLPECQPGPAALRDVKERLEEETGYGASEFLLLTPWRRLEGARPLPTILLAPRLTRVGEPPGNLELVPLAGLVHWVDARKAAGTRVDPKVDLGILMAERQFPRWALGRLQEALRHLRGAAGPRAAASA